MVFPDDSGFIFEIIDYLFSRHKISFFISTKDFDVLYRWWEKKIPTELIKRSIDTVIRRRRNGKGKPVDSFLNFSHEVKKNISIRHDLMTNAGIRKEPPSELNKVKEFFEKYPEEIREFEKDFRELSGMADGERRTKIEKIYDLLVFRFRDDEDLNIKMKLFMGNLPDSMKNENIADKFRRNYLKGRFRIPDFDND